VSIHYKPTPPNSFDPEEQTTGVSCLACGGEYRHIEHKPNGSYVMRACPHCLNGMMTPGQVAKWKSRKKQP
jgi:hypothetical protein